MANGRQVSTGVIGNGVWRSNGLSGSRKVGRLHLSRIERGLVTKSILHPSVDSFKMAGPQKEQEVKGGEMVNVG